MDLLSSPFVNAFEANAIGRSLPWVNWDRTAPTPYLAASTVSINGSSKLGYCRIGGFKRLFFKVLKESLHSADQINVEFFRKSLFNGCVNEAKLGINLL